MARIEPQPSSRLLQNRIRLNTHGILASRALTPRKGRLLMLKRTLTLLVALSIVTGAFAQKKRAVAPEEAQVCSTKVATEIKWHDSIDSTLAEARKESKLVFFVHMLGKIDGDT